MDLVGYVLGMGILFFVSGVVGHCAVRRKSFPLNMGFMFLAVCIMVVCAGAAWMCFNKVDAALAWLNRVSQQDNVDLSALTTSMGLNVDIASLSTTLAANLRKLGLAFACMFVVQVPAVVSAGLFVWAIKSWKVEHGLAAGAQKSGQLDPANRRQANLFVPGRALPELVKPARC